MADRAVLARVDAVDAGAALNAIQRALIGSSGPGGMVLLASAPAHAELGTCQEGLVSFHCTS